MRVTAIKPTFYAGRQYRTGEELNVSERDAKTLTAVGKVKRSPPKPSIDVKPPADIEPVRPKKARDVNTVDDDAAPRKARYRRRDMRAEVDDDSTE